MRLYPLTFQPIFKERLWGGRSLERLYSKVLPANLPIGESWEMSDRPGDVSVVEAGPLAGKDLHSLLLEDPAEMLGSVPLCRGRFPLLAKILDARETLSLQVHPPETVAGRLQGEPKTEMWYLGAAEPGAELFAGLKRDVGRAEFESRLQSGMVAECFHRLAVQPGDAMFMPSGRVHGVGAGCVIFEIQQNSDTTYRVFDWNRVGPDGKPRDLHIPQSLASIDFTDVEPGLIAAPWQGTEGAKVRSLVDCPWFSAEVHRAQAPAQIEVGSEPILLAIVQGVLEVIYQVHHLELKAGRFCFLPAALECTVLKPVGQAEFLVVRPR